MLVQSMVRKIPQRREWQPTPVFLPGESHGQRSLAGYSLWDCKQLDMTEATQHTPTHNVVIRASQDGASSKESAGQCKRHQRRRLDPWVGKIPSSRKWQPTSVFLPGKSHTQRSLASYSPWGCKALDMTEQLSRQARKCSYIFRERENLQEKIIRIKTVQQSWHT